MFRHILIPVDASDLSQRVPRLVCRMLKGDETPRVTLLYVQEPGHNPSDTPPMGDLERLLWEAGADTQSVITQGDATEEILRIAEAEDVGLIAMATHGRSGLTKLLRGSVAERVLRHSRRPLLLYNPAVINAMSEHRGFERILLPHDGSDLADQAIPPATALARVYGAELILFRVENFATGGPHHTLRAEQDVVAELEPLRAKLEAHGIAVRSAAAVGADAREILKAVERFDVDLLAMTSHGRSGVSNWWFGSVAEALAQAAPCPLFVVRVSRPSD